MAKQEKFLEKNYDLPDGTNDAPITRAVLKARGVKDSGSASSFLKLNRFKGQVFSDTDS